jgi:hypothetical protein
MNNEPVAWISVLGIDHIGQKFTDVRVSLTKTDVADIPLYTHPADLTDEEIEQCFADSCTDFKLLENGKTKGVVNIIDVGRAILKKASEK